MRESDPFSEQPREVPDWPVELLEPVEKLGEPDEVFRIPRTHAARKVFSGLALMVGGGIANYVYWVVLGGPLIAEHLLFLCLFGPILTGVGLMYAAWRDRGLWVLVYAMGILRWQRGEVVTFPWSEVTELAFYRVVECGKPKRRLNDDGEIETSWLPIAKEGSKSLGAHLVLRREDGAEAILPSAITDFAGLCKLVQEETFRVMWPSIWTQFMDGSRVRFGDIALSVGGIHRDGDFLPWYELDDALVQNGKLVIRSLKLHRPWMEIALHSVINPHVFVALLIVGPKRLAELNNEAQT